MKADDLAAMVGEWFGVGQMTMGAHNAFISEHVTIDRTDADERLVYTRISRIEMAGRNVPHHEVGYTGERDISFLLSRGSYVRLEFNSSTGIFEQTASTPDTRNMTRKIVFTNGHEMVWDSAMEVFTPQHSSWVRHTIVTNFSLVGVRV